MSRVHTQYARTHSHCLAIRRPRLGNETALLCLRHMRIHNGAVFPNSLACLSAIRQSAIGARACCVVVSSAKPLSAHDGRYRHVWGWDAGRAQEINGKNVRRGATRSCYTCTQRTLLHGQTHKTPHPYPRLATFEALKVYLV